MPLFGESAAPREAATRPEAGCGPRCYLRTLLMVSQMPRTLAAASAANRLRRSCPIRDPGGGHLVSHHSAGRHPAETASCAPASRARPCRLPRDVLAGSLAPPSVPGLPVCPDAQASAGAPLAARSLTAIRFALGRHAAAPRRRARARCRPPSWRAPRRLRCANRPPATRGTDPRRS